MKAEEKITGESYSNKKSNTGSKRLLLKTAIPNLMSWERLSEIYFLKPSVTRSAL